MRSQKYLLFAVAVVAAFAVGRWTADTTPTPASAGRHPTKSKKVVQSRNLERTDVTPQQLHDIFRKGSKLTSLQQQEALDEYRGKLVQWQGSLKSAYFDGSELRGVFTHKVKPAHPLARRKIQVSVTFPESEKTGLLNAPKGSSVTYEGLLNDHTGSYKRPWHLTNGRLVSVE